MNTPFWTSYISEGTIKAICWTLIHSLWIGLIIALLCGIVIATTRKSTAALRYKQLCGLLILFVFAIGVTLYIETGAAPSSAAPPTTQPSVAGVQHNIVISQVAPPNHQTILDSLQAFLNQNTAIIFMVWLLFSVLKSLKMVSGLLYIQRIRNYKIQPVSEELKRKIELFSNQIGIRRVVRLVQSELVKVPVAVGWLKPMILLPVGITLQLTPEQLDSILWHELAHIRRRDYLVNILQGLVETVFFFNPGLLWLSSLIRTEREACCDDVVLSRTSHKANYLEALLAFGYSELKQAGFAMGIGSGNQLCDRLKRMISQENKRLSTAEKSILAVGLVILSAFTTISKDNPVIKNLTLNFKNKPGKMVNKIMPVSMHGLPEDRRINDAKPVAHEKNAIALRDTLRFTNVLFKHSDADLANNDISAKDDKGNIYHFIVADGKIASMELNSVKIEESKLPDYEYTLQYIINVVMEKRRFRNDESARINAMKTAKGNDTLAEKKHRYANLDSIKIKAKSQLLQKDHMQPAPKELSPDARASKFSAMLKRRYDDSVSNDVQRQRAINVIADLVKDKIVAGTAEVKWFGLSETEFIVNGQKQLAELQQRYKAKYGVHAGYGLYYGPVQMTGTGVFIDAYARPTHPARPRPKYMGAVGGADGQDSIVWKQQQLIRQQQLFAASENAKRASMIDQQQRFTKGQNAKSDPALEKQRQLMAQQDEKLKQSRGQHPYKPGIDLKTPITGIISDLVTANVINDKSDLVKFNLTNAALLVNGRKQPEDIHEKLKAKYLDHLGYVNKYGLVDEPNYGLHFNAETGSMGLGVTSGPDSP